MTEHSALQKLTLAVAATGSLRAYAEKHGFSPAFLSFVLNGQKRPSKRLLATIGLERVSTIRRVPS